MIEQAEWVKCQLKNATIAIFQKEKIPREAYDQRSISRVLLDTAVCV